MSEEPAPQPVNVYVFGSAPDNQVDVQHTPLVLWLTDRPVDVTPELLAEIRGEFRAQERYRTALVDSVQVVVKRMVEGANEHTPSLEHPCASAEQALWRGYGIGKYEAYSEAAVALSEVVKAAAVGVGT